MSRFIKKDEDGFYVFDEREFLKTLPNGLEYFAVDEESEHIYNLGFNYKQKMDKQIADLEAKLAEKDKEIEKYRNANMIVLGRRGQGKKHLMQIKIKEIQNQKAIEQLEKLLQKTQTLNLMVNSGHYVNEKQVKVVFEDVIMQTINELKGKVEDVKQ